MRANQNSSKLSDILDRAMFSGVLLFLLALPFHLVIKKLIPDPMGTFWKEILLGVLALLWALRSLLARRLLITRTPLDWAALIYLGVLLVRFLLDRNWWVGAWGLYSSVMYLPMFWIVASVLHRRPDRLIPLVASLVGVGALVALGGLLEFVWNVPLWPSDEMVQSHGFPGVFIYATNIRRVYFTFDSPTTLANTLAILLPLALALILIWQRLLARLAAVLAAALIASCIVVTFSRGIWVATVLSLVVMGVWLVFSSRPRRNLIRRNWKPLAVVVGALALLALAWAAAWFAWKPWETSTYEGVVELSNAAYETVPVSGASQELLETEPLMGNVATQTWSLLDPITGQDDMRNVLYQHPPESGKQEVIYGTVVPTSGALRFAIALSPQVWSPQKGDGVSFQVYVADAATPQEGQLVFTRYINPKFNITDRRWRNFLVDLSDWDGKEVHLSLLTDAGKAGDWSFDWAGWAEPQLISVAPRAFDSAPAESAIGRHTGSLADWTQDETNRDRLSAWSQGLAAWRGSPLWGMGLGTTGVAALRTHPESALVTESQVLKALVELGPLGLLALVFLWFQIGLVGYRSYCAMGDSKQHHLLVGILTGLLVVFIEGFVYQNLEVKQVNAYFWTMVGVVAFFASQTYRAGREDRRQPETIKANADPEIVEPDADPEIIEPDADLEISERG
jgi:O-antigen ligase